MSVTVIEALENAEINIGNAKRVGLAILPLAQQQLHNAIGLLEKGYSIHTEVEPMLEKFGTVENVPDNDARKAVPSDALLANRAIVELVLNRLMDEAQDRYKSCSELTPEEIKAWIDSRQVHWFANRPVEHEREKPMSGLPLKMTEWSDSTQGANAGDADLGPGKLIEPTPAPEPLPAPLGWQCPVCGEVMAPWMTCCMRSHARALNGDSGNRQTRGGTDDKAQGAQHAAG